VQRRFREQHVAAGRVAIDNQRCSNALRQIWPDRHTEPLGSNPKWVLWRLGLGWAEPPCCGCV